MKCETCQRAIPDDAAFCPYCGGRLHGSADPAEFEYAAFISYRHQPLDQEIAKRVQQAIETYRLPRGIAQEHGRERLGKCFRDEDELAAAHSLPDRILDALSKSSSLIVVCTPSTKESVWVRREVEAFVEMRGRERVFTVLADGSSNESIPDYLKTELRAADHGRPFSNPLAADMRPEAASKAKEEMLRLVAAIVGCGFDDLKQRDRSRRRKRVAFAAIAAFCIVVALAATLALASAAHRDSLVAESKRLAVESTQLLARGDRYGAIETALAALPQSGTSNDRPLLPEARSALEEALDLSPSDKSIWKAGYEIKTEAPLGLIDDTLAHASDIESSDKAGALAISESGGFFAVSDSDGNVSTYDLLTGRKLADCAMPEEAGSLPGGLYVRSMCATEHYLVIGNAGSGKPVLAWFDAESGKLLGKSQGTSRPSFDTSFGADLVSMALPIDGGGYGVLITDLSSGQADSYENPDAGIPHNNSPYFNTPGDKLGTNFAVFGDRLFRTDLGTGEGTGVTLAYPTATSISFANGLVVAISAEAIPENSIDRRFSVEAFDENLAPVWSYEGVFSSEMIVNNGVTSLLMGEPVVYGPVKGGSGILVSSGRAVLILDSLTGALLDQYSFDRTVTDVAVFADSRNGPETMFVSCSNGTVNCIDLFDGSSDPAGDGRRLTLPFPVRWAHVTHCDGFDVLLAIPADAENSIVSFRADWNQEDGAHADHSLDELIALANEVLAEGGRTNGS